MDDSVTKIFFRRLLGTVIELAPNQVAETTRRSPNWIRYHRQVAGLVEDDQAGVFE